MIGASAGIGAGVGTGMSETELLRWALTVFIVAPTLLIVQAAYAQQASDSDIADDTAVILPFVVGFDLLAALTALALGLVLHAVISLAAAYVAWRAMHELGGGPPPTTDRRGQQGLVERVRAWF